jgi:hypothetical protein
MKVSVSLIIFSVLSFVLASSVDNPEAAVGISARDSQEYCTKCSKKYQACRLVSGLASEISTLITI